MKKLIYLSFALICFFFFSCKNNEERTDKPNFVIGNGYNVEEPPIEHFYSEPEILNFADSNILKQNSINKVIVLKRYEEIRFLSSNIVRWDTSNIFDFDKNGVWKTKYEYEQKLYSESEYVGKKHNIKDTVKECNNGYWIGNKHYFKKEGMFFDDSTNVYREYNVVNDTGYIVYDSCYDKCHYGAVHYKYNMNNELIELKATSFYEKGANSKYTGKYGKTTLDEDTIMESVYKIEKPIIVKNKEGKIIEYKDINKDDYKYVYEKGLLTKAFKLNEDSEYKLVMEIRYNNMNLPISFKTQQYNYSGSGNDFIEDYNRGKLRGYGGVEYKIVWIK